MSGARKKWLLIGVLFVVGLLLGGFGYGLSRPRPAVVRPVAAPATQISTAALESQYGIKLTRIGVTGAGGLVELRFSVLDPQKARQLLDKQRAPPTLIADDTGFTLQAPQQGTWRNIRLQQDASCFVLFPNARSAVKRGSKVSLAFGQLRVESVVAL